MAITKKAAERPSGSVFSKGPEFNYAGTHLLVELWQGVGWTSLECVERVLRDAVKACGATLLEIRLHRFSPFEGISGVAIIQESHVSIHTWPEFGYAAVDLFMCGKVNPYNAIDVFKRAFKPKKVQIMEVKRGIFDDPALSPHLSSAARPSLASARGVEVMK